MHTENLTILFVDIAGFTATTNRQSRRQNASLLQNFESLLKPIIRKFSGQLVKSIGDALLLTFHSPTDAMLCACSMQDRVALYTQKNPDEQAIVIRIAAHLGEVRTARHDVFGEAVNLTSRIEAVTPAGEIYLSEAVYLAMNKTEVRVQNAGQFTLVGFDHPLTLYQVQKHPDAALPFGSSELEFRQNKTPVYCWLGAVTLGVALSIGIYWQQQPVSLQASQLPQMQPQRSQYLRLKLDGITATALSPALKFGIQQSLEQAVARLSGLYLSSEKELTTNSLTLELNWATGIFPKNDQLQFILLDSKNRALTQWSVDWVSQQSQQNLFQTEQQLVNELLRHGSFKELLQAELQTEVPDSFYQQYLQGLLTLRQGEEAQDIRLLTQAQEQLRIIHQALPKFRQAGRALCHTFSTLQELTENTDWLTQAKSVCPILSGQQSSHADLLAYGRFLQLTRENHLSQQVLLKVLADNPKSGQAYTLLAQLYLADNQPLEAELVLKRAITMQPDYWPAMQWMAVFLLERGQIESAISHLQKVILLTPDNATALTNLGTAFLLNGQFQAAADTYQSALQKGSEPFIQANLATVFYYLGRLTDAIALYQQALQQDQTDFALHGNIADAYRQNNQPAEAQLHYQQASQLISEKPRLNARELALHAHYLAQLGQDKQSQAQISKALTGSSQIAEVWLIDAIIKSQQGLVDDAVVSAAKAVSLGYPIKLLAADPDLHPLAHQPEFLALLRP